MAKIEATVKTFYGDSSKRANKHWEQKRIKLEKCASHFRQNPILPTRKLRIDDPLPVFETFPRQQMAFDYARTCHQDVHVFAKEKDDHGKRVYIVATLPQFWHKYRREHLEDRNYYEVIPEGAACRLYFDLEFKTEFNPQKNGSKMVDIFIKYVFRHLTDMYKLNCDRKIVIDLDSSTTSKFSRHLIFHLPGSVFKDNIHAGNFVRHICTLLERKLEVGSETLNKKFTEKDLTVLHCSDNADTVKQTDLNDCKPNEEKGAFVPNSVDDIHSSDDVGCNEEKENGALFLVNIEELRELIIKDGKGGFGIFCDQGVYTKNRNFRIFKSTKIGKNSHLLVSSQNTFKPSFKDRKGSFSKDLEYLLFLDSLVSNVSMQIGGKDVKVLTCDSCVKSYKISPKNESQDLSSSPSQCGYEHSPYPDIDIFISRVINKGGIQGEIRRWVFFPQGKLLTYDILKNRWCENIGRPHKSNHIMIVVDLRLGVYYQKCHDPDCKRIDYRSPGRAIPDEINPLSNTQYGEFFESDDDDDQELCKAAAECEELGCDDTNRNCRSSEKKDGTLTTEYNREEVYASGASSHIKWDEDEDDGALLQVEIPEEGYRSSTRSLMKCPQNTIEALQGNDTKECSESLDSGNERSALNYEESLDTMRSEKVGSRPESNLIGSDNKNKLDCASDEDVCNWLDEDPVSDLELSFAAEEVELKENLATDFIQ